MTPAWYNVDINISQLGPHPSTTSCESPALDYQQFSGLLIQEPQLGVEHGEDTGK